MVEELLFPEVKRISLFSSNDIRGNFTKIFNDKYFQTSGLSCEFKECFISVSHKNVIRGLHFQAPPFDHIKLVSVLSGSVRDVVVDLRKGSPNYGKYVVVELNSDLKQALYIPSGFAHGFLSLEDNTSMMYMVTEGYHPESDCGIRWDSIAYIWGVKNPIISERDKGFVELKDFESPFTI